MGQFIVIVLVVLGIISVYLHGVHVGKKEQNLNTMEQKNTCKVISINPESEDISEHFGITNDRLDTLINTTNGIVKDMKIKYGAKGINAAELLERISQECKHANELAIISLQIGASLERMQNPFGSSISDFLSKHN